MKKTKLEVIRINEDVIVTSVKWSTKSYKTGSSSQFYVEAKERYYSNNENTGSTLPGTNYYNMLDGQGKDNVNGYIFVEGVYYHCDENSFVESTSNVPHYSNWKTCNEENCGQDYQNHRYVRN